MSEKRITNKRIDTDGGVWVDRRLAFNKYNLSFLPEGGWKDQILTIDDDGITSLRAYGSFISVYDTTTQTATLANTVYSMSFNSVEDSQVITIENSTEIHLNQIGTFDIQFSAQLQKASGGTERVAIWIAKNGVSVPNSNTELTITGGSGTRLVAAWNWVVSTTSINDYYELYWGADAAGTTIVYDSTPFLGPAIPSIILTVAQIN